MTTATAAKSRAGFGSAGVEQATGSFEPLRGGWENFRSYHKTLSELRGLSDRQLSDLGMSRSSLGKTARLAVYGK